MVPTISELIFMFAYGGLLGWAFARAYQNSLLVPKAQKKRFWKAFIKWIAACMVAPAIFAGIGMTGCHAINAFPADDIRRDLLAVVLVGVLIWILPKCLRFGKGSLREWAQLCSPNAETVQSIDHRSPVIYLRSFGDDGAEIPQEVTRPNFLTYEHTVLKRLQIFGPCIAIGKPGEELPELGAARLYVAHDQWQAKVAELLQSAAYVVICASRSGGLIWEIEHAFTRLPAHKVILMFPWRQNVPAGDSAREADYDLVRESVSRVTSLKMPDHLLNAVFIAFGKDDSIKVIGDQNRAKSRKFEAYVEDLAWWLAISERAGESRAANAGLQPPAAQSRGSGEDQKRSIEARVALDHEPMMKASASRRTIWCILGITFCVYRFPHGYRFGGLYGTACATGVILFVASIRFDVVARSLADQALREFGETGDETGFGQALYNIHMGHRHRAWNCWMFGLIFAILVNMLWIKSNHDMGVAGF